MADILHKIKIDVSPLTKRINLYRMGKSLTDSLETRDVTGMVYGAVIAQMMDGFPKGATKTVTSSSGEAWDVTVMPVEETTRREAVKESRVQLLKDILLEMHTEDPNLSLLYWSKRINEVLSPV